MDLVDILVAKSMSGGSGSGSGISPADFNRVKQTAQEAKNTANTAIQNTLDIQNQFGQMRNDINAAADNASAANETANEALEIARQPLNFGAENAGSFVSINQIGELGPSIVKEQDISDIQDALDKDDSIYRYIGIEIDYENNTCEQIKEPIGVFSGSDFSKMPIYRGINRCLVDDNGEIICFYGDDIYLDEYTSGYQTMDYIPKFYYMRKPLKVENGIIKKERILISDEEQKDFKIHPAFINKDGAEVDYILYSAYEGSTFDVSGNAYNRNDAAVDFAADKLSSIANAKPISGEKNELTAANAEKLAQNRGTNWHISSIKAESALQMLFIIEYCSINSQDSLEKGISEIVSVPNVNCASYTGSTAALGNTTGAAAQTINEKNGEETTYSENGTRAFSYRGIENPWGNMWRFIRDLQVKGNGSQGGGIPQIYNDLTNEYEPISFSLPNNSDWISGFGYDENFDWLFMPAEAHNANSAFPIGDYLWIQPNLNGTNAAIIGGLWSNKENNGLFYYGFDKSTIYTSRAYSARLMLVPKKDTIHNNNVSLWKASIGG